MAVVVVAPVSCAEHGCGGVAELERHGDRYALLGTRDWLPHQEFLSTVLREEEGAAMAAVDGLPEQAVRGGDAVAGMKVGMASSCQSWRTPSAVGDGWRLWKLRRNQRWETASVQDLQTRDARRRLAGSSGGMRSRISPTSSSGRAGGGPFFLK